MLLLACSPEVTLLDESRQATGVKVGEVTESSAIIWMRVTENESRRQDGVVKRGRAEKVMTPPLDPLTLHGSVPGAPGRARVRYGRSEDLEDAVETPWTEVTAERDFTAHIPITGLAPATTYHYAAETSSPDGLTMHKPLRGSFRTAPPAEAYSEVSFTVITGQANRDTDHEDGFLIYDAMAALNPHFIVPTGDTVYYDSDQPLVTSIELARYHWHRMYSFPKLLNFHLRVPGYWEKDDHDSYHNDNWPGMSKEYMGTFTWEQGLQVYDEQVPMSEKPYRTFRWGKALQIWLTEGRDFRSPNTMPDGPEKSIWGQEQKEWLKRTLLESDADWRILVSPTPIVGPDRTKKADNHANAAFAYEGDEFRRWVRDNVADNFFIACGDRHWQYHSIHPETKVHEFSSGSVSDQHAGGSPGYDDDYHKYHREIGGFLSVTVQPEGEGSTITFRFHDVAGNVMYEYSRD